MPKHLLKHQTSRRKAEKMEKLKASEMMAKSLLDAIADRAAKLKELKPAQFYLTAHGCITSCVEVHKDDLVILEQMNNQSRRVLGNARKEAERASDRA